MILTVNGSAIGWYKRAAELGDKRAAQRLKASPNTPMARQPGDPGAVLNRSMDGDGQAGGKNKDKDCVIM